MCHAVGVVVMASQPGDRLWRAGLDHALDRRQVADADGVAGDFVAAIANSDFATPAACSGAMAPS